MTMTNDRVLYLACAGTGLLVSTGRVKPTPTPPPGVQGGYRMVKDPKKWLLCVTLMAPLVFEPTAACLWRLSSSCCEAPRTYRRGQWVMMHNQSSCGAVLLLGMPRLWQG